MQKKYRNYLIALMGGLGVVLAAIIGSAIMIDPYALYREHDEYIGLNKFARLIKPHWAAWAKPEVVISGSSRAEYFFDTDYLQERLVKPVFNIATSGANIYEVRRNIEHVVAVAPIDTIIVGLDFFMFNANRGVRSGFSEDRLALRMNGGPNPFYWAVDLGATLASRDVFNDMRRSIKYRDRDTNCTNRWNGQAGVIPTYFECRARETDGQQNLFREGLAFYLDDNSGLLGDTSGLISDFELDRRPLPSNSMENIDRLFALAAQERELILYISPVHALHLEMLKCWGRWTAFEDWKITLTRKVAQARARGIRVELRDFAIISDLTSRSVFEQDASTQSHFYDSHHLRQTQRTRLQEELLGHGEQNNPIGVVLTPEMLETHLARTRAASADWNQAHPLDMAAFNELVRDAEERAAQN